MHLSETLTGENSPQIKSIFLAFKGYRACRKILKQLPHTETLFKKNESWTTKYRTAVENAYISSTWPESSHLKLIILFWTESYLHTDILLSLRACINMYIITGSSFRLVYRCARASITFTFRWESRSANYARNSVWVGKFVNRACIGQTGLMRAYLRRTTSVSR